jgi:hypothetical protein
MRLPTALLAAAAALAGGAAHAASVEVEVKDAVAQVTVIPEDRTDVRIEIVHANPALRLNVRTVGDRTVIDGELDRRIRNCRGSGDRMTVRVQDLGEVSNADIPKVVIRTPRVVVFHASGAVFGAIGRSDTLEFANAGCGDWTIANVRGRLEVSEVGSGDIRAGSAREARLKIAGSGAVSAGNLGGPVEVNVAGSGDVTIAGVSGPLNVRIAGSGDVRVLSGRATTMTASIAGSGDVEFDGIADSLSARIAGSGDVRANQVKGKVSKAVLGSGEVTVGS